MPAVEVQKEKAKAAAKLLDRALLSSLKTQRRLPEHLDKLFEAGDILKERELGAWKTDMQYASAFADSFQKFDIDSVPLEAFGEVKPIVTAEWFTVATFKGQKLALSVFKWVREVYRYGA